jgi:hypothetical protein
MYANKTWSGRTELSFWSLPFVLMAYVWRNYEGEYQSPSTDPDMDEPRTIQHHRHLHLRHPVYHIVRWHWMRSFATQVWKQSLAETWWWPQMVRNIWGWRWVSRDRHVGMITDNTRTAGGGVGPMFDSNPDLLYHYTEVLSDIFNYIPFLSNGVKIS